MDRAAFLASALIIYFFAYLTHKPHEVHERYRDTNVFWVKGKILEPMVNWLYMFQNFHLVHHLFPRVPFYLYPKAFRSLKPVLDKSTPMSNTISGVAAWRVSHPLSWPGLSRP